MVHIDPDFSKAIQGGWREFTEQHDWLIALLIGIAIGLVCFIAGLP
jgi:hypothetical protein